MHRRLARGLAFAAAFAATAALAQAPGQAAPDFTITDTAGKPVKLSDLRGKYVVLEWTNPDCPFVRNQYNKQGMQTQQKRWSGQDVVWVTINSTHRNHSEFKTPAVMSAWMKTQGGAPSVLAVDGESAVARTYGVKTTPEMYVIDPTGKVIYAGAIDDGRSPRHDPLAANNYVQAALTQAKAGQPVAQASTASYGCSLKY
ncbi:MAG TPA: thioredoxin family protein [Casimicrobiaceae bacterium]|nr:thioredoxin family protein [Casimicrobiaceae bacterium]